MIPAYTIDTWEEAERLVPDEDYGPPFWLETLEAVLRERRHRVLSNFKELQKIMDSYVSTRRG